MGLSSYILLCLVLEVAGDIHHLFASSYRSPALFALQYDTNTNALTEAANFNAHAGHPWMAFSHDKNTLYASERDGWSSYRVLSPSEIAFQSHLTLKGRCDGTDFKHGTTNILAGQRAPYSIYGAGRSPCGNVIGAKRDGSFDHIVQNVTYKADSRVYGMAHDPSGNYIYSADTSSNGLWTHKVDPASGKLTAARFTAHPEKDARPRRLVVHPSGNYLYVVLSTLNKVAVYSIQRDRNGPQLVYTGKSFSLVPPGQENKRYRGSELALSAKNDILYLTSRYQVKRRDEEDEDGEHADDEGEKANADKDRPKRRSVSSLGDMFVRALTPLVRRQWTLGGLLNSITSSPAPSSTPAVAVLPGYLTGLQLSESPSDGNGAGYPLGIILQVSTSTSGGKSSVISAAPWSNEHVTLADSELGLVQVWRFEAVTDGPQSSPTQTSGNKFQSPPLNNPGPNPPNSPNSQSQPIAAVNGQAMPNPQSQPQPQKQPLQPQWQPPPPPLSQAIPQPPKPNLNLIGNQNLAPTTPTSPKGVQPPNPPQEGEPLPAFSIAGRSLEKRQPLKTIRASIVSEWKAPSWAIGAGDPAAPKNEHRGNEDRKGQVPGWGRGCCAHALWYD